MHMHARTHTHTHTHTLHTWTHPDIHTGTSGQGDWRKSFGKEKGFQGWLERTDRGSVMARSGKLTTGLCAKSMVLWTSGVCRRTELWRRSVNVKRVCKAGRVWPGMILTHRILLWINSQKKKRKKEEEKTFSVILCALSLPLSFSSSNFQLM